MMMDRKKMLVAVAIALGLFFLMVGAILADMGRASPKPNEPPEADLARQDLRNVWGPAVANFGVFLLLIGLVGAALLLEEMDAIVRLFLLILAFVALLLVLANSPTLFR